MEKANADEELRQKLNDEEFAEMVYEEMFGEMDRKLLALQQVVQEEKQRAEQEKQRAEQEKQRAEQEKHRAERLAAKLRDLGVDPDEYS